MKTNDTITTAQKRRLATRAFCALDCLNNIKWTAMRDRLEAIHLEDERAHRRFGTDFARHHPGAISANEAARIMAVRWVAGYLTRADRMPKIGDVLSLKPGCVYAAALVANYRKEIRQAWRGLDVKALAALDYCEFVRVKEAA